MQLQNLAEEAINPATLEGQAAIVDAIQHIEVPAPPAAEGGATETTLLAVKTAIENIEIPAPEGGALETGGNLTAILAKFTDELSKFLSLGIYNQSDPTLSDGGKKELQLTKYGCLKVAPKASLDPAVQPTIKSSTAAEASNVIKALAGILFGIMGYNASTSDQFIQVHDAASLPANTAVPVAVFKVGAGDNFFIDPGQWGISCTTGIVVCNSSTYATKTIGSANCFFTAFYK